MLVGISGFYPSRIAKEMTWNRVANLTGRVNGNIGLDLVNEFLNKDFKEMLKRSRGTYTKAQVQRCCQLSGAFGRYLDDIFMTSLTATEDQKPHHQSTKYDTDVQQFLEGYKDECLFDFIPGRQHSSFPNFKHAVVLNAPEKMGSKLVKLSQCMDRWKEFVQ